MQGNFTHPNLNLSEPIRTDIGLAPGETTPRGPEIAISNSFGFGGINTSIVVSKSRERNSP
jgi:malonyl-ACP decarboxylase